MFFVMSEVTFNCRKNTSIFNSESFMVVNLVLLILWGIKGSKIPVFFLIITQKTVENGISFHLTKVFVGIDFVILL